MDGWNINPVYGMIKIKQKHQVQFSFSCVEVEDVYREVDSFDAFKAIQQNDIPVKYTKANRDTNLLRITKVSLLRLNQFSKKNIELIKKTTDLSAFNL